MANQREKTVDVLVKQRSKWAEVKIKQQDYLIASQDNFRQNEIFTDVELECEDGSIKAHKLILSAACSYFNAMFQNNMSETISGHVDFKKHPLRAVDVVVRYLYTGVIDNAIAVNNDVIKEVLKLSHLMQLNSLFDYCWEVYEQTLNVENFVEMWNLAEIYELSSETRTSILSFAVENFSEISTRKSGFLLTDQQVTEFVKLLGENSACSMDEIVKFILKWGKSDIDKRMLNVVEILKIIDIGKLSNILLHDLIEYEKYLTESADLIQLFHDESTSRLLKPIDKVTFFNHDLEIHFYFRTQSKGDLIHTYSLKEKKWFFPKPLPEFDLPTQPLSTEEFLVNFHMFCLDDWFYFASETDDKIIKYNPTSDSAETILPNFTSKGGNNFDNRLRVEFGKEIYAWDFMYFKKFNSSSEKWKFLSHCPGKYNECDLVATKQAIYLWNKREKILKLYDVKANKWKFQVQVENNYIISNPVSITSSKGKLWFLDRTTIVMYDPVNDIWDEKSYSELKEMRHIPIYNDQPFLLFCERSNKCAFWLFDPTIGNWEQVPSGIGLPNWFACAVST